MGAASKETPMRFCMAQTRRHFLTERSCSSMSSNRERASLASRSSIAAPWSDRFTTRHLMLEPSPNMIAGSPSLGGCALMSRDWAAAKSFSNLIALKELRRLFAILCRSLQRALHISLGETHLSCGLQPACCPRFLWRSRERCARSHFWTAHDLAPVSLASFSLVVAPGCQISSVNNSYLASTFWRICRPTFSMSAGKVIRIPAVKT